MVCHVEKSVSGIRSLHTNVKNVCARIAIRRKTDSHYSWLRKNVVVPWFLKHERPVLFNVQHCQRFLHNASIALTVRRCLIVLVKKPLVSVFLQVGSSAPLPALWNTERPSLVHIEQTPASKELSFIFHCGFSHPSCISHWPICIRNFDSEAQKNSHLLWKKNSLSILHPQTLKLPF